LATEVYRVGLTVRLIAPTTVWTCTVRYDTGSCTRSMLYGMQLLQLHHM